MKYFFFSVLITLSVTVPLTPSWATGQEVEKLYNRHCGACHGIKGDGKGPAAYLLSPKPRDFTLGVYKFRSTPTGEPPTDEDLLRTIKLGINGTAMPAWDRLKEGDLKALVGHLKTFSDVFESEDDLEPPIPIGTPPSFSKKSVLAGQKVYKKMECFKCHGPSGKGDGPAAGTLKDDQERPIRPYDFTRGAGLMKGGTSARDIYRTFMTGLDGTPMPSFIDDLEEDQRWQLVHFIQSLSPKSKGITPKGTASLHATKVSADPSLDPNDPIWNKVPITSVALRPLWARDRWIDSISVQTVVGEKMATFRLQWQDPKKNEETIGPKEFRDAVAIQFAPQGNPVNYLGIPFIGMGDSMNEVMIWHWKADWQADKTSGFRDVIKRHGDNMDKISQQADLSENPEFHSGMAAANPMSATQHKSPVEILHAKGFGTLTSLPPVDQTVEGQGRWNNGVWTVVMRQAFDAKAASLKAGQTLPVGIAAWNGEAGDRNGQKSVSQWMELVID